ncbi:MAG: hypothetical protein ABJH68_13465 [Ilumatobacter sp.]|uniref:hypothetical protein n=1 Tax=Ilumatobacter sp. TaxID=1967498 RepID=UPI003297C354
MQRRQDPRRLAARLAVIAIVVLPACASSDGGGEAGTPDAPVATAESGGDVFTEAGGTVGGVSTNGGVDPGDEDDVVPPAEEVVESVVEGVVESLPAVAETGVPGIESDDGFCRAWSTYAGSVQAISLAWALQAPVDAARLEVAATSALRAAVAQMADELPDEIESNRQALTVDVPGPFLARADRAGELLAEAGLDGDRIDALGVAWVEAITEQGLETESLTVDVPADSTEALDAAAEAFIAELPSVLEDPTLDTTEFDIGPSLEYITAACPDQGTLAGNDDVDSGGL